MMMIRRKDRETYWSRLHSKKQTLPVSLPELGLLPPPPPPFNPLRAPSSSSSSCPSFYLLPIVTRALLPLVLVLVFHNTYQNSEPPSKKKT
jgi:hypothetical protein